MTQNDTLQGLPAGKPMPAAGELAEAKTEKQKEQPAGPKKRQPQGFETTGSWIAVLGEPLKNGEDKIKELTFGRVTMKELLIYEDYTGRAAVEESAVSQQKLYLELIKEICASMTGLTEDLIWQLDPVDWMKIQLHIKYKMQKKQEEMTAATKEMGVEMEELLQA